MVSTSVRISSTKNIPDHIDAYHWEEWKKSGVVDEIIALNVRTVTDSRDVDKILNRNTKRRWKHSDELVPAWRVAGINPETEEFTLDGTQVKPDVAPLNKDGKPQKYLSPSDCELSPLFLDVGIPGYWPQVIEDKSEPCFLVEGPKKAGSVLSIGKAAVSVPGVSTCRKLGRLHKQLESIAGFGRTIYIGFDSDILTKRPVQNALLGIARELSATGSKVMVLELPEDTKGVDDFLVAHGEEEFNKLVERAKTIEEYREFLKGLWQEKLEEIKLTKKSKLARFMDLIRMGWGHELKYNKLKTVTELREEPLDLNQVRLKIALDFDVDIPVQDAQSIVEMISTENSYNPVENYLDQLSARHPAPDLSILDNIATRYFGTDNPLYDIYMKKTLVAAVVRSKRPGCKHDTATILVGKQGAYKSTFWRVLFGDDFFTDELGDANEKDELMKLHRFWCLEWSEFETVYRRKDVSSLKKFMSSTVDAFRTPYSRSVKEYPRKSILVGTTNEEEILNDPTGSRRFWIIPVKNEIDIALLEEERDLLWAAAYALYQSGEKWWLDSKQSTMQEEMNKGFQVQDPWIDSIESYVSHRDQVGTAEIFTHLGLEPARQDTGMKRRITAVLRSLGWVSIRKYIDKAWKWIWEKIKVEKVDGSSGSNGSSYVQQNAVQNATSKQLDPIDPDDPSLFSTFKISSESTNNFTPSVANVNPSVQNATSKQLDPIDPDDPSSFSTFKISSESNSPKSEVIAKPEVTRVLTPAKQVKASHSYWSRSFGAAVRVEKIYPSAKTADIVVPGELEIKRVSFTDLLEDADWTPRQGKPCFYGRDRVICVGFESGGQKFQVEYPSRKMVWVKRSDLSPAY